MIEVIKGVSITVALCVMTSMGGRKKDSYLIGMAGCCFILIYMLMAINGAAASMEASWFGQAWDKFCGFISWIFN